MYREVKLEFSELGKFLFIVLLIVFYSCGKNHQSADKSQPPAKVENAKKESELSTVTLSPKAEERLGIKISTVINRKLPGSLKLGGEIIAVPGNEVRIAAPVAGTVLKSEVGEIPIAGKFVKRGQEILRLLLLPPEKDLLGAREEVTVKQEQLEVAKAQSERAKQLLASKAISEKVFEEVQVELTRAKAALKTATARMNLLSGTDLDVAARNASTLVLESPVEGVLQRIFVAPGQTVPPSTVLFEIASINPVWVRVPVYVGDLAKIDLQKDASIKPLGTGQDLLSLLARPVQGPPLSDARSASADLFFEISNNDRFFRIGQKVSVSLLQKSPEDSLVVPISAILYDINGGSWVYTKVAPHVYSRRRVEVSHIVNDFVVLARGLKVGDQVVVAGAAEIFGTEFGVGK
ncbi:MAG: efflux RND transporter periplasmic adaptor subunit [Candidatus Aminicenantes bacterium]|nr:efflux RND transporter periplasmic adaptor subunit [Candidatus Aminicenantes bacterium]